MSDGPNTRVGEVNKEPYASDYHSHLKYHAGKGTIFWYQKFVFIAKNITLLETQELC